MIEKSFVSRNLLIETQGHLQKIILNRPQHLNAINLSMIQDITSRLKLWVNDPHTSVVTLKGAGNRSFCAGGDLKAISNSATPGGNNEAQKYFKEEFSLNYLIGTYRKPFISILNGITFGGAAGLSVIGRFCVSTERSEFSMPECAIGLFPDVGSSFYLSRLPKNIGLFLGLTGHRLKGRDIQRLGLSTHYIDNAQIAQMEEELMYLPSPTTFDSVNNLLNRFQQTSTTNFPERFSLEEYEDIINYCFTADSVEEILEKLQSNKSDWALKQIHTLRKMSPTSLKITHRLLKEGQNKSLSECLQTDYRLASRCLREKDFYEGIRAVILDKDYLPKWSPANLTQVSSERLNYYFSPLEHELVLTDDHY